jgi:hypothetical protein
MPCQSATTREMDFLVIVALTDMPVRYETVAGAWNPSLPLVAPPPDPLNLSISASGTVIQSH